VTSIKHVIPITALVRF